jgi:RNA polymerase sigma factor FliA
MQLELKWKKYLLSSGKDRIKHRNVLFDYYMYIPRYSAASICKKTKKKDFDELFYAGQRGLFKAIESYDPGEGDFERYARTIVHCFMLEEIRSDGRFTPWIRKSMRIIRNAKERYRLEYGRRPSDEETAQILGINMKRYRDLEERNYFFRRKRTRLKDESMLLEERVELLEIVLKKLTKKQKRVVYYYFYEGLNTNQIGKMMGCTGNNIGIIKRTAMRRARKGLEEIGISAEDLGC